MKNLLSGVNHAFSGESSIGLLFLGLNGAIPALCRKVGISPVLGFIICGMALGPNGLHAFQLPLVNQLGELGIMLFLFEMGLELSVEKVASMKQDVFCLGSLQFVVTTFIFGCISKLLGFSFLAAFIIGSSLSLSSSAFVVQLLKEYKSLESDHAKPTLGILLFQDLAVVPLLVIIQLLLSSSGNNFAPALVFAACKFFLTVMIMLSLGSTILKDFVSSISNTQNRDSLISTVMATTIAAASFTHAIGLSESLGAFTMGITLSSSPQRYQIEHLISPIRAILLSVFFVRVGCAISLQFVVKEFKTLVTMVAGLVMIKSMVISGACSLLGKELAVSRKCGLLNAQGGEFAFVALAIAENYGLLPPRVTQMLLTTVAISMAITPFLAEIAEKTSYDTKVVR